MRPIIMVMLLVDLGIVLATTYGVAIRTPTAERLRPIWSSFVISLLVGGSTSVNIAGDHFGQSGADILGFVGPLMVGMAVMAAIVAFSERRKNAVAPTS